ncbi:putative Versican core protein [Paratrimastix pyriformis]|uniref:Versican core protein n=1 Tax=Paratrimastix pyriformis TaxID=342808 RepID=A0ABQ8UJ07_9EUKA|nr:putative Versican core protein [Paratrimastix pyriformis]
MGHLAWLFHFLLLVFSCLSVPWTDTVCDSEHDFGDLFDDHTFSCLDPRDNSNGVTCYVLYTRDPTKTVAIPDGYGSPAIDRCKLQCGSTKYAVLWEGGDTLDGNPTQVDCKFNAGVLTTLKSPDTGIWTDAQAPPNYYVTETYYYTVKHTCLPVLIHLIHHVPVWLWQAGYCLISGVCYGAGNTSGECRVCDPDQHHRMDARPRRDLPQDAGTQPVIDCSAVTVVPSAEFISTTSLSFDINDAAINCGTIHTRWLLSPSYFPAWADFPDNTWSGQTISVVDAQLGAVPPGHTFVVSAELKVRAHHPPARPLDLQLTDNGMGQAWNADPTLALCYVNSTRVMFDNFPPDAFTPTTGCTTFSAATQTFYQTDLTWLVATFGTTDHQSGISYYEVGLGSNDSQAHPDLIRGLSVPAATVATPDVMPYQVTNQMTCAQISQTTADRCGHTTADCLRIQLDQYTTPSIKAFAPGQVVYLYVRAVDKAGASVLGDRRKIMFDATPPISSVPTDLDHLYIGHDPAGSELYSNVADEMAARWAISDPESDLDRILWGFGTVNATITDESQLTAVGLLSTATMAATLVHGKGYYVAPAWRDPCRDMTVKAYNRAGLSTTRLSTKIVIDLTPPSASGSLVNNTSPQTTCTGYNTSRVCYQTSPTITVSHLKFTEDVEPITKYQLAIGTVPGGTSILDWTVTSLTAGSFPRSYTPTGLNLTDGTEFYLTIRATNMLGMFNQLSSGANTIDTSPPICEYVQVGIGAATSFASSNSSLGIQYGRHYDPHSGLAALEVSIARNASDPADDTTMAVPWRPLNATSAVAVLDGLELAGGVPYYVRVRATNRAGLQCRSISAAVTVDGTPPLVDSGRLAVPRYLGSLTHLNLTWAGAFADPESGLSAVTWMLGDQPGTWEHARGTYAPATTSDLLDLSPPLVDGGTYYITSHHPPPSRASCGIPGIPGQALVVNGMGQETYVGPLAALADTTPPSSGTVLLGTGGVVRHYQTDNHTLAASWSGFTDGQAPITGYRVALYRVLGEGSDPALVAWTDDLSPATLNHTFTGLDLASPADHFLRVRCTNGAGLYTDADSVAFRVTTQAPSEGLVFDGCAQDRADQAAQTDPTTLCASWDGLDSPDQAHNPVARVEYAVGTGTPAGAPGWDSLVPLTVLADGLTADSVAPSRVTVTGLTLASGTRYYTTVVVTLASGLARNATSDGIVVDLSPPQTGAVAATMPAFVARRASLLVAWSGFADPESGIAGYQWRVYAEGAPVREVEPLRELGLVHSALLATDGLPAGRYFIGLVATNGVGYAAQWNSSAFAVDETPPAAGTVWVGPDCAQGVVQTFQREADRTGVCWTRMPDTDGYGGAVHYEVLLLVNNRLAAPLYNATGLASNASLAVTGLSLACFDVLTATVTAINQAGLRTVATSSRVVVDSAPPRVNFLRDGRMAGADLEYTTERQVAAVWSFTAGSGIAQYRAQVREGSCAGAALTDWTTLAGSAEGVVFPAGEILLDSRRMVVAVEATSNVDLTTVFCTNGAQYDGAAPVVGSVRIEGSRPSAALGLLQWPAPDIAADLPEAFPASPSILPAVGQRCLTVSWADFADSEAGVAEYRVGFGTGLGLANLVPAVTVGLRPPHTACGLPLGQPLYATVCAYDYAGRQACGSSPRAVTLLAPGLPAIRNVAGHTPTNALACAAASATAGGASDSPPEWVCRGLALNQTLNTTRLAQDAAPGASSGLLVAEVFLDGSLPEGLCAARWWVGSGRLLQDLVAPTAVALDQGAGSPLVNVSIPLRADLSGYYLGLEAYSCMGTASRSTVALHLIRAAPALPAGSGGLTVRADSSQPGAVTVSWPAWGATADVPIGAHHYQLRDTVTGATTSGAVGPTAQSVTPAPGALALVSGRRYEVRAAHHYCARHLPSARLLSPHRHRSHRPLFLLLPGRLQVHVWAYSTAPGAAGLATASFVYDQSPPTVTLAARQEALSEADLYAMAANASAVPRFTGLLCAQWAAADPQSRVRQVVLRFGTAPGLADLGQWNSSSAADTTTTTTATATGNVNNNSTTGTAGLADRACVGPLVMTNPLVGRQPLYASLTATNAMGLETTATAKVRRALLPGAGLLSVGCAGDPAAGRTTADGTMGLQATPGQLCARWDSTFAPTPQFAADGSEDAAELTEATPARYGVAVTRVPGGPAIEGLTATLDGATGQVHFDAGGLLAEGEAYWVQVTGTTADGRARTALSRGTLLARRDPEPAAVEAQFVCLPGGASTLAGAGCGAAEEVALQVSFTEAGLLADELAGMRLVLLEVNVTAAAGTSSSPAVVTQAQLSIAGLAGTATGATATERRYSYTYGLGPFRAGLACGRRYMANVTLSSQLGATSATLSSGEFQLCPTIALTAAYNPAQKQVEGTWALSSFHYVDGQLALACAPAANGSLVTVLEGQRLAEPTRAYTVSTQPQFGLLSGGAFVLPLPSLAALKLANGAACAVTLRAQYRTPADQTPPEVVALPAATSPRFTIDTTGPALTLRCLFAEGQWWPAREASSQLPLQCAFTATDAESAVSSMRWALGTRPNGTDLLPYTECPLSAPWPANGTATGTCVAPAALASQLLHDPTAQSVWVAAVAANGVGLQAWTAAWLRVERTEPGLREAWLECAPEAAGGWVAAVGWRELFDMQSGVANLTVALFDGPTGAALGRRVLPEVGSPQPLVAPSPDATGRVSFPLGLVGGAAPASDGTTLCPYWADLAYCDRAGRCFGRTLFG